MMMMRRRTAIKMAFLFLRFIFVVSQVRHPGRERESRQRVRVRGSELSMSTVFIGSNSFFFHPPPSPDHHGTAFGRFFRWELGVK